MLKPNMIFKGASVAPLVVAKIRAFVKSAGSCEIGGAMVGFESKDGRLIITDIAGPGPKGKCLPFNVMIDGEHSQNFCDQAHRRSNGLWDFVGDWHCHPSFLIRPSEGDQQAMKLLADTPKMPLRLVSLIYSSWTGRFRLYQWCRSEQRLLPVPMRSFER